MNSQERAEKIAQWFTKYYFSFDKEGIEYLTAQIAEAEREALAKTYSQAFTDIKREAYAEGFRAAREKAKGIAERTDIQVHVGCRRTIARRIGEMEP